MDHGAGGNAFRGVNPPPDGHRSRSLYLDVRVSHPDAPVQRSDRNSLAQPTPATRPVFLFPMLRHCLPALGLTTLLAQGVGAQARSFTPWRAMLGTTAVDLRVAPGEVRLGVAGDSGEVGLVFSASDVRRFTDSLTRLMSRRSEWSVRIEEPGVSPGALGLSRIAPRKGAAYHRLFASDDVVGAVTDSLSVAEAQLLVRKLRQAALAAAPPVPRAKAKRRGG